MKPTMMNKLKATMTPKDPIIPIGKSPRRRKSSRFHIDVQGNQELEKLPGFNGKDDGLAVKDG
jgi:serine/threonine-protein phosphatase 2A regulatory subunit B'